MIHEFNRVFELSMKGIIRVRIICFKIELQIQIQTKKMVVVRTLELKRYTVSFNDGSEDYIGIEEVDDGSEDRSNFVFTVENM